ncbi:hypothetical protein HZS_7278 [Henneguya salminicola]|nr:hypothetical protein HZS_7278 [Henneguya salminicola]
MSDTVSERSSKLFQILTGKAFKREKYRLYDWEPLLDAFFAFYDVCCTLDAQKRDKQVGNFVRKFRSSIDEIRSLRPNKNDFEYIKTIGRGHFGEVYVVKEKGTNDIYAMKILTKAATLSNDNIAFYEEERDIMAFAGSPWVTSLQYAFQDAENLYLVMEFLPGGDLLNLLSRYDDGIMEEDDARFYLCEIIMAVHAVHLIGYVHRDVKPENILLDMTGHVKLADFGSAARLVNGKSVLCKMPVGTPEYIAPEVLQSMNSGGGIYGCECDWWSVGVVLYEMLCGCTPFEAETVLLLYSQIMNFKNTLVIPDHVSINEHTQKLIYSLLDEQKKRIKFNELAQHEFFKSMDWTTLKSVKPPYIPQLKDSSDTSHFTEFNSTRLNQNKKIEPTLGNSMPFIGFTFTKNISGPKKETFLSKTTSLSHTPSSSEEPDRTKDVIRQAQLNEQLNIQIETLNLRVKDNDKRTKKLENDLITANNETNTKKAALNELNEKFQILVEERNKLKNQLALASQDNDDIISFKNTIDSVNSLLDIEKANVVTITSQREILKAKLTTINEDLELANKKIKDSDSYWREYEKNQTKNQDELKNSIAEIQSLLDKSTLEFQEKLNNSFEQVRSYRELSESLSKKLTSAEQKRSDNDRLDNIEICELSNRLAQNLNSYEELNKKYHEVEDLLKAKESEYKTNEIIILKLNQTIRTCENHIQQNESKIKELENSNNENAQQIQTIKNQKEQLNCETIKLKSSLEQKDKKVTELQDAINKHEISNNDERKKLNEKINQMQIEIEDFKSSVLSKQTELTNLRTEMSELEQKICDRQSETSKYETEINQLNSVISVQKASNFAMSQQLEESNWKLDKLENENEEINSALIALNASNREQIIKFESTISQQNKLINFLHVDTSRKKGSKTKVENEITMKQPLVASGSNRHPRDMEQQLEMERVQTLKLNKKVIQLEQELKSLKADYKKAVGKTSATEPSKFYTVDSDISAPTSVNDLTVVAAVKKEHILFPTTCSIPNICFVCLTPIAFAKPIVQCSSCKVFCHTECQNNFPTFSCNPVPALINICCMFDSNQFYKIFSDLDNFKITLPYTGYLSVPHQVGHNKYDWHKRLFELTPTKLVIRTSSDTENEVVGVINFKDMTTPCRIRSAVHTSDLFFTPLANAGYVFGLEICHAESPNFNLNMSFVGQDKDPNDNNTILFMRAQSMEEKRFWVRIMNDIVASSPKPNIVTIGEPILAMNTNSFPNISSILHLTEDLIMVGCQLGVFLIQLSDKSTVKCFEDPIEIHDLCLVGNSLFALLGSNKQLARLRPDKSKNSSSLSLKKSTLSPCYYKNIENCFAIHVAEQRSDAALIFVSRSGELLGIKITTDYNLNVAIKIPVGDITISSVAFYENFVIYCQDKYYVYDVEKDKSRELLDSTDHNLAFLIYGSTPQSNYPMNVFRMTRTNKPEFLICCSEFALIVDQDGRCLSGNSSIRWDDIPLSFHYFKDNLCVCYPDKIELRSFKINSLVDLNQKTKFQYKYINCPIIFGNGCGNTPDNIIVTNVQSDYSLSIYKLPLKQLDRCRVASNSVIKMDESRLSRDDQSTTNILHNFQNQLN